MNTRKLRKAILTLCSALLLVSLSVGITLAYLTDEDAVVNTFTVGKVGLELTETDVKDRDDTYINEEGEEVPIPSDEYGTVIPDGGRADKTNDYKLYPGRKFVKDPVIDIDDDSDLAYLRVVVTFENGKAADALGLDLSSIFYRETGENIDHMIWGWNETWTDKGVTIPAWSIEKTVVGENVIYTLTANTHVDGATPDIELFDTLKVPETMENSELNLMQDVAMNIQAYAVQADGFNQKETFIENAYAAFEAAWPGTWNVTGDIIND